MRVIDKLRLFIRKHIFEYLRLYDSCFIDVKFRTDTHISFDKLLDDNFLICTAHTPEINGMVYHIEIYHEYLIINKTDKKVFIYDWTSNIELVREMIIDEYNTIYNNQNYYIHNDKRYIGNGIVRFNINYDNRIKIEYLSKQRIPYQHNRYTIPRCYQSVFYRCDTNNINMDTIYQNTVKCIEIFNKSYNYMLNNWIYR
jgi:hypothetical protein